MRHPAPRYRVRIRGPVRRAARRFGVSQRFRNEVRCSATESRGRLRRRCAPGYRSWAVACGFGCRHRAASRHRRAGSPLRLPSRAGFPLAFQSGPKAAGAAAELPARLRIRSHAEHGTSTNAPGSLKPEVADSRKAATGIAQSRRHRRRTRLRKPRPAASKRCGHRATFRIRPAGHGRRIPRVRGARSAKAAGCRMAGGNLRTGIGRRSDRRGSQAAASCKRPAAP